MPEHAFGSDRDLGHEVGARERRALRCEAAQRNAANDAIVVMYVVLVQKLTELTRLLIARNRGSEAHAKSLCACALNALPGACPGSFPAIAVVLLGGRAIK